MKIRISVQHQYACSSAGWRLRSSDNDKDQVYVNIIDNLYFIVQARVSWYGT